jgi:hypothetical protein
LYPLNSSKLKVCNHVSDGQRIVSAYVFLAPGQTDLAPNVLSCHDGKKGGVYGRACGL